MLWLVTFLTLPPCRKHLGSAMVEADDAFSAVERADELIDVPPTDVGLATLQRIPPELEPAARFRLNEVYRTVAQLEELQECLSRT